MENEIITRRRLIIILVTASVLIFIGLVWLIARLQHWSLLGANSSSITPDAQILKNCANPIAYWKAHPELFPSQVVIGGTVYQERELEALLSDDSQDTGQQIRSQLAVAFLNSLAGADQSSIEATIFDAYAWLVKHPAGSQITAPEQEEGMRLLSLLETYNTGFGKVAPCESNSAVTKTVTSTTTYSLQTGIAPSHTGTSTSTATPTLMFTIPGTEISPSDTPIPTTARPGAPSYTPTRTSPAGPTITPTTQAPTPTHTSAPTFTHTPLPSYTSTVPPTITPTPTLPPTLPPTDTPGPTLPPAPGP